MSSESISFASTSTGSPSSRCVDTAEAARAQRRRGRLEVLADVVALGLEQRLGHELAGQHERRRSWITHATCTSRPATGIRCAHSSMASRLASDPS